MGRWTPLGEKHEGLVWPVLRPKDVLLSTTGSLVGVIIPSTVAETISKLHTHVSARNNQRLAVDVYRSLNDALDHGGERSLGHLPGGGGDVSPGGWYAIVTRQNTLTIEQADAENITVADWWVPENDPPDISSVTDSHSGPLGIAKNNDWTIELKRDDGATGTGRAKAWMNESLLAADIAAATGHAVTPGLPYIFGAFVQAAPGLAGSKSVRVGFSWWNAAGTAFLGETAGDTLVANQENMLTRPFVQHEAPAGAGRGIPFIEIVFTNPAADSSQSVFFDGMMRTQAIQLPNDYVDPGIDFEVANSSNLVAALISGDGIRATGTGFNEAEFPLDITPGTYAGKRIAGIKLACAARSLGGVGNLWMSVRVGGFLFRGTSLGVADDQRTQLTHESFWSRNPLTQEPWTPEDLEGFADGTNAVTLHWEGGNALSSVEVQFFGTQTFFVDETRIATGHTILLNPSDDTDATVVLDDPFTKDVDDVLFVVWRKDSDAHGLVRLFRLDSGDGVMPLGWAGVIPKALSINGFGDVGIIEGLTEFPNRAVPLTVLEQSDGDISIDSQPYAQLSPEPVGAGNPTEQEFTPATPLTVGAFVAAVRVNRPTLDVADLTLRIREGHEGSILAAATVKTTELEEPLDQFQIVARTFNNADEVTLEAGTQYVLEAITTGPTSDFFPHWEVAALEGGEVADWSEVGYGGIDDALTNLLTGGRQIDKDAVAWVATRPEAPTLLAIQADTDPSRISLQWAGTGEIDFWYYELQRSDDDNDFVTIAQMESPSATSYVDGAGRLGVECAYRVRVVRTDWAPSEWSDVLSETMPLIPFPGCETVCSYSITAPGVDPDDWVEVVDLGDGKRTYRNPDDLAIVDLAGADAFGRAESVAFRSPGLVLDRFSVPAMVYGGDGAFAVPGDLVGREAFNALVDLSVARAPYIVVRDSDGNRWYSAIKCNEQVRREPAAIYTIDVDVSELTRHPLPLQLIEGDDGGVIVITGKYAADVGDGVTTEIVVEHNLGTRDVLVRVYRNAEPGDRVHPGVARPTVDTVLLTFAEAPELAEYRVVIFST